MVRAVLGSLLAAIIVGVLFMWLSVSVADAATVKHPPVFKHKSSMVRMEYPAILRTARETDKLVIVIHGGGWHFGKIRDTWNAGIDQYALGKGYDVLSIAYPLTRGAAPKSVEVVRGWVGWATERGYKDITLLGGSAGGYLAVAASDTVGVDRVIAISPPLSFGAEVTIQTAVAKFAWGYGFNCMASNTCEDYTIRRTNTPTTILHSEMDRVSAYTGSYYLWLYNRRVVKLITLKGAKHGWALVWRYQTKLIPLP